MALISFISSVTDSNGFLWSDAHNSAEHFNAIALLSSIPKSGTTVADVALTKEDRFSRVG
jgi:hypothetical protein